MYRCRPTLYSSPPVGLSYQMGMYRNAASAAHSNGQRISLVLRSTCRQFPCSPRSTNNCHPGCWQGSPGHRKRGSTIWLQVTRVGWPWTPQRRYHEGVQTSAPLSVRGGTATVLLPAWRYQHYAQRSVFFPSNSRTHHEAC